MIEEIRTAESGANEDGATLEAISSAETVPIEDRIRTARGEERNALEQEAVPQVINEAQRAKDWWNAQGVSWQAEGGPRNLHYSAQDENGLPVRLVVHSTTFRGGSSVYVDEYAQDPEDQNRVVRDSHRGTTNYNFKAEGVDVGRLPSVGRADQEMMQIGSSLRPDGTFGRLGFWTNTDFSRNRGKGHPLQDARRTNDLLENAVLLGEERGLHVRNGVPKLVPVIRHDSKPQ